MMVRKMNQGTSSVLLVTPGFDTIIKTIKEEVQPEIVDLHLQVENGYVFWIAMIHMLRIT
jgi:hypothetical protein